MSGTSCVATCPEKTYNVLGVCTSCSDHCRTCGDGAVCTVCEAGWNLINTVCSDQCPTGFYKLNGACEGNERVRKRINLISLSSWMYEMY